MNTRFSFFSLVLFVALALTACEKDEEVTTPAPQPEPERVVTITVDSPLENAMYSLGQEVHINVDIEANFELHGYAIRLVNTSNDNEVILEAGEHDHGTAFHYHEHWTNNVTMHSDLELQIEVARSHDHDDVEVKTVHFHCHPM
jgi:hypothetical protein